MVVPEIVRAGIEDFVPVIIFLVVIGRIVSAVKNASSGKRGPANPAGGARKLENDLERFFSNLEEKVEEAVPPPPPPVPAARKVPKRVKPVPGTPPPPPAAARPLEVVRAAPKAAMWGSENYGIAATAPKRASCSYAPTRARKKIIRMLKDEESLQKAVLLREVLGPPVALRHQEQIHA